MADASTLTFGATQSFADPARPGATAPYPAPQTGSVTEPDPAPVDPRVGRELLRSGPYGIKLPWFLPFFDDQQTLSETPTMRLAYRRMLADPNVKAAFLGKLLAVCSLDLKVTPSDRKDDRANKLAELVRWNLEDALEGGVPGLIWSVLSGALIDGYSVCEKVWDREDRGQFKGAYYLRCVKPKDAGTDLVLVTDEFRNITAVRGLRYNPGVDFPPESFLIYRHLPLWGVPTGQSDFRAVYGRYWLLDTVLKLRAVGLEKRSLPVVLGHYTNAQDRPALEEALSLVKSQNWLAVPETCRVEALSIAGSADSQFAEAVRDLKHDIFLGIAGAILQSLEGTTTDGRGDSQVHRSTADLFVWHLSAAIQHLLNDRKGGLVRELCDLNAEGVQEYPKATLSAVDDKDLSAQMDVATKAWEMGLALSRHSLYEMTGLEAPDPEDRDDVLGGKADQEAQVAAAVQESPHGPADVAAADRNITDAVQTGKAQQQMPQGVTGPLPGGTDDPAQGGGGEDFALDFAEDEPEEAVESGPSAGEETAPGPTPKGRARSPRESEASKARAAKWRQDNPERLAAARRATTPKAIREKVLAAGAENLIETSSSIDEAFDRGRLSDQEKHLLRQRLLGRSRPSVSRDPEMRGGRGGPGAVRSSSVMDYLEAKALAKLGAVTLADLSAPGKLGSRPRPNLFDDPRAMERAFDHAGLGPRARHLLRQRLAGRTFEEIARDPEMAKVSDRGFAGAVIGGGTPAKDTIRGMERRALARLGFAGTMADFHRDGRADRAAREIERGRAVKDRKGRIASQGPYDEDAGATHRAAGARREANDRKSSALERLARRMMEEHERGELDPERKRWYDDEARRIHQGTDEGSRGAQPQTPRVSGAPRGRGGAEEGFGEHDGIDAPVSTGEGVDRIGRKYATLRGERVRLPRREADFAEKDASGAPRRGGHEADTPRRGDTVRLPPHRGGSVARVTHNRSGQSNLEHADGTRSKEFNRHLRDYDTNEPFRFDEHADPSVAARLRRVLIAAQYARQHGGQLRKRDRTRSVTGDRGFAEDEPRDFGKAQTEGQSKRLRQEQSRRQAHEQTQSGPPPEEPPAPPPRPQARRRRGSAPLIPDDAYSLYQAVGHPGEEGHDPAAHGALADWYDDNMDRTTADNFRNALNHDDRARHSREQLRDEANRLARELFGVNNAFDLRHRYVNQFDSPSRHFVPAPLDLNQDDPEERRLGHWLSAYLPPGAIRWTNDPDEDQS